jgi:DNA-binding response OmpR family regulator
MDPSIDNEPVVRLSPGCFSRASVATEAGEVEVRLSRYGNWIVHIRRDGEKDWRIACNGDIEVGVRASARPGDEVVFGPLRVLRGARRVLVGRNEPELSGKEFELLVFLLADPFRVFRKEELMKSVWGHYPGPRTRSLDTHASRLRRKLADAGAPGLVVNQWGIGYRLAAGLPGDPSDTPAAAGEVVHLAEAS